MILVYEKGVHYRCSKCGVEKPEVRHYWSVFYYCPVCCPEDRVAVQRVVDFAYMTRRRIAGLMDELREAEAMLSFRRRELMDLVQKGEKVTTEDWKGVGLRPDEAAKRATD
ncbi:MAG: hypothetical protein KA314_04895 [Chloroflexi bacterium]|nr:hypothetical protein [Chloroflexota bacterium]